ncbi:hypothetical protein H257_02204 [Aphanomyces astaci]|uniref:Uncharacterized protein n=1 Tax=Aphanomyces astaci TaxID=112090 RepID=W4H5G4_APHAT|nr:hypothetical protein H257_02204 [Aphanomyces astaci]ETV87245.1 hypothetical protein H257_02204 [Aphanomyces astaci]|eukprot:XP_009824044.1 hypothetical protein H257_02204 [Aphanomyces astaci]
MQPTSVVTLFVLACAVAATLAFRPSTDAPSSDLEPLAVVAEGSHGAVKGTNGIFYWGCGSVASRSMNIVGLVGQRIGSVRGGARKLPGSPM